MGRGAENSLPLVPGVGHLGESSEGLRSRGFSVIEDVRRLFLMALGVDNSSGVEGRVLTSTLSTFSTEPENIKYFNY